jgi:hypothetical protein
MLYNIPMSAGKLTATAGRQLSDRLKDQGYELLFDHGDVADKQTYQVGAIVSWFGEKYGAASQLAHLDIAVIDRASGQIRALIEIEETSANPKTIIGDIYATLLGDHVTFQGQRQLNIGDFTTLIVLMRTGGENKAAQLAYLEEQARKLKEHMHTGNAAIGDLIVTGYTTQNEWMVKLNEQLDLLLPRS